MTSTPPSVLTHQTKRPLSGLRGRVRRHPIAAFLILALGLSYLICVIPILVQYDVIPGKSLPGRLGIDMEEAASFLFVFAGLVPATFVVTGLEGGQPAIAALFRRMLRWRVNLVWWLTALVALPAGTVALAVAFGDAATPPSAGVLLQEAGGAAFGLLVVNLWEEAAWAGFLQTRLERRHNFFVAAALTAVPFAAIHMPLQVINGETSAVALAGSFATLLVLAVVIRSLLGAVMRVAVNSILLAALTHTMFNRANNTEGIAALILGSGDHRQVAALLATLLLTVALVTLCHRKLRRSYRAELDRLEADR